MSMSGDSVDDLGPRTGVWVVHGHPDDGSYMECLAHEQHMSSNL